MTIRQVCAVLTGAIQMARSTVPGWTGALVGLTMSGALLAGASSATPPGADPAVRVVLAEDGLGSAPLRDVAWSPDGRFILADGDFLSVIEVATGRQIWADSGFSGPVAWVGGSGRFVARSGWGLAVVDLASNHYQLVPDVKFSSESQPPPHVAGAADSPVFAFELGGNVTMLSLGETGTSAAQVGAWDLGKDALDLAMSPDGATLAVAAGDVHLLSPRGGSRILQTHDARSVAWGKDGLDLYVLDDRDRITTWGPTTGQGSGERGAMLKYERRRWVARQLAALLVSGRQEGRVSLRVGARGALLVTMDEDRRVVAWDAEGRRLAETGSGLTGVSARALAVSPVLPQVALAGGKTAPTLQVWEPGGGAEPASLEPHGLPALVEVAVSDRFVLARPEDGAPWVLDLSTGRGVGLPSEKPTAIAVSGGAHPIAAVSSQRGGVRLWELGAAPVERAPISDVRDVLFLALAPDGVALAVSEPAEISAWSTVDGALRWRHPLRQQKSRLQVSDGRLSYDFDLRLPGVSPSLTWSPDGQRIAVDLRDEQGTVLLLDASTGAELGRTQVEGTEEGLGASLHFDASGDGLLVHHGVAVELRSAADLSRAASREASMFGGSGAVIDTPQVLPRPDGDGLLFLDHGRVSTAPWPEVARPEFYRTLQKARAFSGPAHARGVTDIELLPDRRTLASAGLDGTLRLWDLDEERELAIVVPVYPRGVSSPAAWTTLTPDGAFDPAGGAPSDRVFYVRGDVSLGLGQLYDRYYRAELLPRVLAREAGLADGQIGALLSRVAPSVTFPELRDGAKLDTACPQIEIEATGGTSPVSVLSVGLGERLLGKDIGPLKVDRATSTVRQRVEACLPAGDVEIWPVAATRDGLETRGQPLHVHVPARGATGYPSTPTGTAPITLHVLAAGVSRYRNSEINLKYAAQDATDLAAAFQSPSNRSYPSVDVEVLTDAQASRKGLLSAILRLQERVRPEDTVVIFLSGHGVVADDGTWWLLAADTTVLADDRYETTALSAQDLSHALRGLAAQKVVILVDSCHAGAAFNDVGGVQMRAVQRVETDQALVRLARAAGVFLIGGSSRDRLAAEADPFGHGLFTWAILEALEGKAGCTPVTAACLQTWTERRLPELYLEIGQGEQFPAVFRNGDDFPLVRGVVEEVR